MDGETKQLKEARSKLSGLEREISECTVKLRSTEQRLNAEHVALRSLAAQRAQAIAQLADANTEGAQRIHKDVDKFDAEIRATERRSESLQTLVKSINATMAELGNEHAKLSGAIAAEVNAKEFAAGRARIEQQFAALHEVLVTARTMMGELNSDAAQFGERFHAAYNFIAPLFDEFLTVEHNQDQHGFRFAYGYRADFRIALNPMLPR